VDAPSRRVHRVAGTFPCTQEIEDEDDDDDEDEKEGKDHATGSACAGDFVPLEVALSICYHPRWRRFGKME